MYEAIHFDTLKILLIDFNKTKLSINLFCLIVSISLSCLNGICKTVEVLALWHSNINQNISKNKFSRFKSVIILAYNICTLSKLIMNERKDCTVSEISLKSLALL